ncbi:MAG TPA: hypothetical protein PKX79_10915 [Spirochaetota bacterium]|nr:hypothetical protein [Spirochaetota bacterium]HOK93450.1 hypothetical protein [Spirochaetota bacterium]HON15711.1 hypothetical protein [Spirochaetota bacterium]HPP95876.1 hypothetical protein [Spirochaetota bacterium]HRS62579.1 hypothetical protein [Spirochaetota bacterium]
MDEQKTYQLIINRGIEEGYEEHFLDKNKFVRSIVSYLSRPKKVFLGLGDFLEIGDYNNLLDAILLDQNAAKLEGILDKNNRIISEESDIPVSFFKLGVYYPDFLLKEVPTECASMVGKKARIFPGAELFVRHIKQYNPLVFTAIPFEISIEYMKRLGLDKNNLLATEYKKTVVSNREVYTGDIVRFISGNRRSIEIEKNMAEFNLRDEDILYIGRGEAGSNTFSSYKSIAFNPSKNIISKSNITIYGSSLESLLVLFNFDNELDDYLLAKDFEDNLPSLVVISEKKEKREELIELELEHRQMQENIIGMKIEYSVDSYGTLEREINVMLGGSAVNINRVRNIVYTRMKKYLDDPQSLVREIYNLARERYRNFCVS